MKYYVAADIHGFFTEFYEALGKAGFFNDTESRKLILLGDLFDRGPGAVDLQNFILNLLDKDEVILVRGNHEDLFKEMVTIDQCMPLQHHLHNGTYDTALQLTGYDKFMAMIRQYEFAEVAKQTPFFQRIMPAMLNYYETNRYVFVHGWIPCIRERKGYSYYSDWRNASEMEWAKARWYNGIDAARSSLEEKTIVCGHWHASYGHAKYLSKGSEFGADACFAPYYNNGIIAIDGCTARSGIVNVLVLEDGESEIEATCKESLQVQFEGEREGR